MLLVASSFSAKSFFGGFYRVLCGPRAQQSYDNSTKTKSHLSYSDAPNLLAVQEYTDFGT